MTKKPNAMERLLNDRKNVRMTGMDMAHQNNRVTQYPLYAMKVERKVYVEYTDDWSHIERKDSDLIDTRCLCNNCKALHDKGEPMIKRCDKCRFDAFEYYNIEQVFDLTPGVFFTEKACKLHIKENRYHYNNPTVYVIGAWRNPEMQSVMRVLLDFGQEGVPSHYE